MQTAIRGLASTVLVACLALPSGALACPDCDASRQARSAVWSDPSFATHVAFMVLPLAVLAIVAALLYRIGHPGAADGVDDSRERGDR